MGAEACACHGTYYDGSNSFGGLQRCFKLQKQNKKTKEINNKIKNRKNQNKQQLSSLRSI